MSGQIGSTRERSSGSGPGHRCTGAEDSYILCDPGQPTGYTCGFWQCLWVQRISLSQVLALITWFSGVTAGVAMLESRFLGQEHISCNLVLWQWTVQADKKNCKDTRMASHERPNRLPDFLRSLLMQFEPVNRLYKMTSGFEKLIQVFNRCI